MDGIVRTLLEFLAYMREHGHEALVIAAGSGPRHVDGFPVARMSGVRFPLYPEITLAPIAPSLGRRLDEFHPDVVHLAGPCVLGATALLTARSRGLPVAAHFQTDLARYAAHFGFAPLAPSMWRYLVGLHNLANVTYAPTRQVRCELESHGMQRVRISGRGVDTELFNPSRRNGHNADLLYVGRVSPEKNVSWLADLAEALPDKHLRVVGDGPGLPPLQRRLEGLPNVEFSGPLYGTKLAEAFASANLFVFPSHTETFGQVVQEAMASGLPVVGVAAGGVADLISPGDTGLLCRPHDRRSFIAAVQDLLADEPARQRMAINARAFAERQTWRSVFDALIHDYQELAASKGGRAPLYG
ncbi:MAG: glycosyltransferase family 1 protein [Chloroflexi bacterium]|nr:glycosyltransferase family 1 protein [Chloroflexota bacterium]